MDRRTVNRSPIAPATRARHSQPDPGPPPLGDNHPIGAEISAGREKPRTLEVIGVAADAKLRTLGEDHPG